MWIAMWRTVLCVVSQGLKMMEAPLPGSSAFTMAREKRTDKIMCQLLNFLVLWK